ncbi:hypothetical protein [Peribacillus sp. SCS-155]|uniref:hypothetical protein n=1 Tax=Peribacillus sedimenti TaxID=3115297 RepID=UPI003905AE19
MSVMIKIGAYTSLHLKPEAFSHAMPSAQDYGAYLRTGKNLSAFMTCFTNSITGIKSGGSFIRKHEYRLNKPLRDWLQWNAKAVS